MSIRYMYEKLKSFLRDDTTYMAILLFLVAIISFGLGRQSVTDVSTKQQSAGVIFTDVPVLQNTLPLELDVIQTQVVVSKSGTKYHLLTCSGANRIKDENKIFFASAEFAQAAGYTPAANCPGL